MPSAEPGERGETRPSHRRAFAPLRVAGAVVTAGIIAVALSAHGIVVAAAVLTGGRP